MKGERRVAVECRKLRQLQHFSVSCSFPRVVCSQSSYYLIWEWFSSSSPSRMATKFIEHQFFLWVIRSLSNLAYLFSHLQVLTLSRFYPIRSSQEPRFSLIVAIESQSSFIWFLILFSLQCQQLSHSIRQSSDVLVVCHLRLLCLEVI